MMSFTQSILADSRAIWHLLAAPNRGVDHRDRLNQFYNGQAAVYDSFRKGMLHGRQQMIDALPVQPDSVWMDLGCGTGENIERFGDRLNRFSQVHLVDLCAPLLRVAKSRCERFKTTTIHIHEADVTQFDGLNQQADIVTFSYSLTMIPDWIAAIENAYRLLRPGGLIGVADFYVSRKHVEDGTAHHGWLTRTAWPIWFAMDNVYLEADRLSLLKFKFETVTLSQHRGRIAYLPFFFKVPYYVFVGRKPLANQ